MFFDLHRDRLDAAVNACAERSYWSPFVESPSGRLHPEGAKARGFQAYQDVLGSDFGLEGGPGVLAAEVSPWTGEPLGIRYPTVQVEPLLQRATTAMPAFARAHAEDRVGVCMEILHRLSQDQFFNAQATMHTAGQAFMMAFAGSGANALDRGLEATAMAWRAMRDVPTEAHFQRSFGPGAPVRLTKRYRLVPRGVTVVFSCATYPAWNAYPAVFASLATGNPVVLKPHPTCVLPMARAVQIGRQVLREAGFAEDLLTLAVDTPTSLIGLELVDHPAVATIDFTGSQGFGQLLEERHRAKRVYTETAGCNPVVLHSTEDLDATLHAVAHSLCCFSSQMCTAAQNLFVPECGVRTPQGSVAAPEVEARLIAAIDALVADPARASALCGAIQDPATVAALQGFQDVLRPSAQLHYPETPQARAASPVLVRGGGELHRREHFGPIGFAIRVADADEGLAQATRDAHERGSIAAYVYSTEPDFVTRAEDAFARAGANVAFNLHRQLPINYAAAYSDFHVTGLNPAGTACLTDLAFVADRFRVVQSKHELPPT